MEFEQSNGVNVIIWLIELHQIGEFYREPKGNGRAKVSAERIQKILDNASAILCNITSLEVMRNSSMAEAVVPAIVSAVLIPIAEDTFQYFDKSSEDNLSLYSNVLYRNCTAVIRNMSCSKDAATRTQVRRCSGLMESLLTVMRVAVTSGLADTKIVENCICAVRNLAYALREADTIAGSGNRPLAGRLFDRTFRAQSRSRLNEEDSQKDTAEPGITSAESILWHPDAVATFLLVLRQASNPVCIEAAAGAIQNLTASKKWPPAAVVRSEVRIQEGLSVLVDLLHFSDSAAVITVVATLRNLILERETLTELGKYFLPKIVTCLTTESYMSHSRSLSSLASFATSAAIGRMELTQVNCLILLPILRLCSKIVLNQDSFTRHFVELGGVQRLTNLILVLSSNKGSTQQGIRAACRQAALQLLRALWKIKRLHPFYWESGLTEADFLQKRGSLMSQKFRPQSRNRLVPMSLAERYAFVEDQKPDKYHQARSIRPNCNQGENFQRNPSAASSSVGQLSLFSNSTRGQSVDALRRESNRPFDARVDFPTVTSTWDRRRTPLVMTSVGRSSEDIEDDGNETDGVMTFVPTSTQRDFGSMGRISGLKSRKINQKSTKMRAKKRWREVAQNMDSQDQISGGYNEPVTSHNPQIKAEFPATSRNAAPTLPPRSRPPSRGISHNRQLSNSPAMLR
ncbi:hypothetical protein Aperf_G00000037641 [Anoplocephala perfoliata]